MPEPFENLKVEFSSDKTQAIIDLRMPSVAFEEGDTEPTVEGLKQKLSTDHALISIIDENVETAIERMLNREVIEGLVIADTKKQMQLGTDGRLEWLVASDDSLAEDAKGRVDFYSFSALQNVIEGQPLGKIHDPVEGVDGLTVTGEPIPAPEPKVLEIAAGDNVEYRESEQTFYALIGGRVELRGGAMFVSRSYQVDGNVDFSTGNVNFDGFVRVTGNVVDNFAVEAVDGVQVDGVVEAANIESGGSVAVLGGINMREKGQITAKGDVITRFITNSNIRTFGNLSAEKEVVNSKVVASTILSPESEIAGGTLIAAGNIHVKEAGSPLGVRTVLHAGYDQEKVDELEALEKLIADREATEAATKGKLDEAKKVEHKLSPEKRAGLTALIKRNRDESKETKAMKEQVIAIRKQIYSKKAQVIIGKEVHAGVVIKIGKYEKSLMEDYSGFRRYVFNEEKFEIEALFD